MTIAYFGSASNPADNGSNTVNTIAVTPPASMTEGQLVLFIGHVRSSTTITVSETGGQTWNALDHIENGAVVRARVFWCRYNGTWSANPSLTQSSTICFSAVMHVFTPTAAAN